MKTSLKSPMHSILARYFLLGVFIFLLIPGFGYSEGIADRTVTSKVTQARLAVDYAWETYHHAALGGTLSSPQVQTDLELKLHHSRSLLAEAYDAEAGGDGERVNQLTTQIMDITSQIIVRSQESKK